MTPQSPLDRDGARTDAARPCPPSARTTNAARPLLLGLAVASAFWLFAPRAEAACDPDTPPLADGGTVTCTGTDETGFDASGNTNVTITTSGTTVLDDSGPEDAAIVLGDDSAVVLGADSTLNVTDAVGLLGGDDNDVDLGGTINVTATGGTGVRMGSNTDPSSPSAIEIQNTGDITITGAGGIGIDVGDNYDVTNEVGGTITVDTGADGGVAMRGVDDDILWNSGTIVLHADDARAIQIRDNTGLPLPNGAINDGTVTVNGDDGIVIEVGDNVGTLLGGTVDLLGANGRGLSIGDRTDPGAQANHTNDGTTNVIGNGGIGIEAGDGWFSGSGAAIQSDIRNADTINVSGDDAFGIRVGDDTNTSGNHNSFVTNFTGATIDVTGTDSVGVSLGGNDVLTSANTSLDDVFGFVNDGTITGDVDAGPLVEFRDAFGAFENRILNFTNGVITADMTNAGTANRGIAIQGTDGVERVENQGSLTGDVFLAGGNDVFVLYSTSTFMGTTQFGDGNDTLRLFAADANPAAFDLSDVRFVDFEALEIDGLTSTDPGYDLSNTAGFTGLVTVRENGALTSAGGITLGGDLDNEGRIGAALTFDATGARLDNLATGTIESTVTFTSDAGIVVNGGAIDGDITFANGDNFYVHETGASLGGNVIGGLDTDAARLADSGGTLRSFDASRLQDFESLEVFGNDSTQTGWELQNTIAFTGEIIVNAGGSLNHAAPITLSGDLTNRGRITGDLQTSPIDVTITSEADSVTDGAIAFGSGDDVLDLAGRVTGDVDLGGGDDTFRFRSRGVLEGTLQGGSGADTLENEGSVTTSVQLGADDDTYQHGVSASIAAGVTVDGGAGNDTAVLAYDETTVATFDLSRIANIERVQLAADPLFAGTNDAAGWRLTNGAGFGDTVEVLDGARLIAESPTNPVNLGGDLTLSSGGAVDFTVDGITPPLLVAGTASLAGTAAIAITPGAVDGTHTVLDAGTRVGTFDALTLPTASGLRMISSAYTPTGLELTITTGSFGSPGVAFGANNRAIGNYLDAVLGELSGTMTIEPLEAEINALAGTDGSLNNVLSALSPESYDAQSAVVMEGGRRVARILMERPRDCTPGEMDPWQGTSQPIDCHARRWAPWISGVGSYRSRDAFSGHPEYDALLGGVVFGLDTPSVAGFDFTLAVSTQHGKVDYERFGDADLTMAEVSGHAAWNHGPLRIQSVVSWAHTRHESRRSIVFSEGTGTTAVAQSLSAEEDFDSSRLLLAAEIGARFEVGPVQIEPIAAVDWIRMEVDGLTESGAGVYDARLESRDDDVFTTRAGLRLGTVYEYRRYVHRYLEWATGVWRPTLDLRWRQTITGNERDVSASLAQAPTTVAPFTVEAKEDPGGFEVGAGLSFAPKYANRLQLQLRYDLYRASHTLDHDLTARLRIGF